MKLLSFRVCANVDKMSLYFLLFHRSHQFGFSNHTLLSRVLCFHAECEEILKGKNLGFSSISNSKLLAKLKTISIQTHSILLTKT